MDTSVKITCSDVLAKRILLDPVYLKIAKGFTIPQANCGERVIRVQGSRKEISLVLSPELGHTWIRHPHLQQGGVGQILKVAMFPSATVAGWTQIRYGVLRC
jgi:hypothetical protein